MLCDLILFEDLYFESFVYMSNRIDQFCTDPFRVLVRQNKQSADLISASSDIAGDL